MRDESIVLVPLTQGKFAVIDAADAERVLPFKWNVANAFGFPVRTENHADGRRTAVFLHHWLSGCPIDTDHIDGDKLNNRRTNLRCGTHSQTTAKQGRKRNNTSGYKGVSLQAGKYWVATITVNYRRIYLGSWPTSEDAARAYDTAARAHFGEFATLNFPA